MPQNSRFEGRKPQINPKTRIEPCTLKIKNREARSYAVFFGATGRTRTADLLITNQLLYQLSHSSKYLWFTAYQ
jgi:hypothetical protein